MNSINRVIFLYKAQMRPLAVTICLCGFWASLPVVTHANLLHDNRRRKFDDDDFYGTSGNYAVQHAIKTRYLRTNLVPTDQGESRRLAGLRARRFRRDFMYVASSSETEQGTEHIIDDVKCFKECNNAWRQAFEKRFEMRIADFYDFPFHPKILSYPNFVSYCELAEQQNRCFIEQCNDPSAERIFSPSNFLCSFKRNQFVRTRPCFEETEPLTFLKCDQRCHKSAASALAAKRVARAANVSSTTIGSMSQTTVSVPSTTTIPISTGISTEIPTTNVTTIATTANGTTVTTTISALSSSTSSTTTTVAAAASTTSAVPFSDNRDAIEMLLKTSDDSASQQTRAEAGKVFIKSELNSYERELDLLCTFQECYKQCHESILREICAPGLADNAIDLITSFVNWHATDVHDWHMVTQNGERLPQSCSRLADSASASGTFSTKSSVITDTTTPTFAI